MPGLGSIPLGIGTGIEAKRAELELELSEIYIGIDTFKFQFRQFIFPYNLLAISWLEVVQYGFIACDQTIGASLLEIIIN